MSFQNSIYEEEFINLINSLNESIKEYYKVSKHNIKETNNFLSIFEKEWKEMDKPLKEEIQNNISENINKIIIKVSQSQNIITQIQKNSFANEQNLSLFFNDAKKIFKAMKETRNENLANKNFRAKSLRNHTVNDNLDFKNDKKNKSVIPILIKKILYYLNQFKDYNEIIGKVSNKEKYNFINLQKSIFEVLNSTQRNNNRLLNENDPLNNDQLNYLSEENPKENINISKMANKYNKEISILNNKIKELSETIQKNNMEYLEIKKIDELKKKIEEQLNKTNENINDDTNINYEMKNDFEKMVLNIIDNNKNLNSELNKLKSDIQEKNEVIKNINLNNSKLKQDLLNKDNIIQEKDYEIMILTQDNQLDINAYQRIDKLLNKELGKKNLNTNNSNIDINTNNEMRKEMQNLFKENYKLKSELKYLKLNITEAPSPSINKTEYLDINKANSNQIKIIKKEYENQKLILKKKYEKENKELIKNIENLSKQLTLKNEEIISLQKEIIKMKTQKQENSMNFPKNINHNLKKSLSKPEEENNKLKQQIIMKGKQLQGKSGNSNYKENIRKLQLKENNLKSVEYQPQIINLQNIINEKDELIKQYKNKIQNNNNENLNNISNKFISLENKYNNLLKELKNKNIEINNLKTKLLNNNKKNNELNNIILNNKKLIQSLNNKITDLKSSTNENNQNELINKYKKEINELNNAFLKTNSIIEQKDLIIKNLKENPNNNNNELEKVINQLKQENKNLTDELMKNNISNKSNQNEEELKNKINLLNLKISSLNEENEYYKNKAEELHEQLKNVYKLKNNTENTLDMIINFSEKDLDKKENNNLENSNNINQLKQEIINLKNLNQKLQNDYNQEKNKNIELIKNKELPDNMNINDRNDNNVDLETKLKKKEEEIEALNTFTFKLQKELENSKEKNEIYESKINLLTKENISIKNQLERLSKTMPNEINALKFQLDEANKRNQINLAGHSNLNKINEKSKIEDANETQAETHNNLLLKLNEKNKEISELKNQNKELRFKLEEKEVKSAYSGYRTEDFNISNYEEEFDLRKMANGAKEKNRSEDVNIDYPGIQEIKDKLKELTFKYTNLVEQVKILLGNINFTNKAKPQITQICQLIGYSPRTTARIFSFPKEKKKLLGIN